MDADTMIEALEREWEFDSGFFGRLRRGEFDKAGFSRLIDILGHIDLQDSTSVDRRVVSLLWYMPLFMGWQAERVQESGVSVEDFDKAINQVHNLLEGILGIP